MQIKTVKEWETELEHFLDCIDFGSSFLDARAIQFWNEWLNAKAVRSLKE